MGLIENAKTNFFNHAFDLRLKSNTRAIIQKYGAEGYGVAMMLLEVLMNSDDNTLMIHENNWESTMFDICCKDEQQFNEYLQYFNKVGLIVVENELQYRFVSSDFLDEKRNIQKKSRIDIKNRQIRFKERNIIIKTKHSTLTEKARFYKQQEAQKKRKRTVLQMRVDTTKEFQRRIYTRFPEIEPLKAIYYFSEKVILADNDYDFYFKEMTKHNFERFFISWLKLFIENGVPNEIAAVR